MKFILKGDKKMDAVTIIWTTVLTLGVILLGWLGSAMDGKQQHNSTNHIHNA
ncbi:MAG: hypothetical protein M1469_00520 [Bacteroidetes bacterium]|nr:hypothetical protein [Bacteroidota bacterium]MCL5266572.1 hypothetical protein [Bacteroidota bacterium]